MADTKRNDAELAYLDDLTGLYNRRYLKTSFPKELNKIKDQKSHLSLFMIDFDNFKGINDTYGHLNGDRVLVEVSDILKNEIGEEGIFIRYAGDEFTVLLSGKPLNEAVAIGNKLLQAISRYKLKLKSGKDVPSFSFSVGVAVYPDDADTVDGLIDKADQALYSAKRMGKNRIASTKDIVSEARDREMVLNALPCRKLIGREKEAEYLRRAYETAKAGKKRYIVIKGGDGIGKTRLMLETFNTDKMIPPPFLLKCSKESACQDLNSLKALPPPALILVDDILWIDNESLEAVRDVLNNKGSGGALVVATTSKDAPEILEREMLDLAPLTIAAMSELFKSVFPGLIMPLSAEKKIYDISGGFPSIVEEIAKHMLNKKIIYPKDGKWMLDEKSMGGMPSSSKELLDKVISELDRDAKEILSKASVLGNDFNVDILKSLYGKNEGELTDVLDKLKREGVLRQGAFADSNILSFMSNVIRESIYNTIRKNELREMHRKIAGLIKEMHKSELGNVYGELRYHLKEAGEEAKAIEQFPSVEEIAEKPLTENSAKIALDVIVLLRAAWFNSHLYPLDNKICADSIENLYDKLKAVLENDPTFTITVSGEDILFNGEVHSKKKLAAALLRAVLSLFSEYGIGSMTFKKGLTKKEIESLFLMLAREKDAKGGIALIRKTVTNIKINEVKYRKASELAGRAGIKNGALIKTILENPVWNELFAISESGIEVKDMDRFEKQKKELADTILGMDPSLRTRIIEESGAYETSGENFISDILSALNADEISKILKEGCRDTKLSPKDMSDFIRIALKSQSQKKILPNEMQSLLKKSGINKAVAARAMEETSPDLFFEDMARKFMENDKFGALDNDVINNLRPLTEALVIKDDIRTIDNLVGSLFSKLDSESPVIRISAAKGLERVLSVLLGKELFDMSSSVITELSLRLKREENPKVYAEMLNNFEKAISALIQKQKPLLLTGPLLTLCGETSEANHRVDEFKRYAKATIWRAITAENMNVLLLLLRQKTEKDYAAIIDALARFGEELSGSLLGAISRKDDMKWDPFDIYMKKQNAALIIKKMGSGAIAKLGGLVADKRPFVAQNAVEIFSYINEPECMPYLEAAMLNTDKETRKAALEAAKKISGGDDLVRFMVNVLPLEKESDLISKIIDVICEHVSWSFIPYVKNELKGKIRLDDYDKLSAKLSQRK